MATSAGRRFFLLGMTLNELAFILFFLLMLISSAELIKKQHQLQQQSKQIATLETQLNHAQSERDENFKKLVLLEKSLQQAGGLGQNPTAEELAQFFTKLQQVDKIAQIKQENHQLQEQVQRLQKHADVSEFLNQADLGTDPISRVENLITQHQQLTRQENTLRGQMAYLQNKLQQVKGSGRDHPPCWADASTGSIEYLYQITLYQDILAIEPAWPASRAIDAHSIPGAENMPGNRLSLEQFKRAAMPVLAWSQANQCRHFVRIRDHAGTSKQAYKEKLLAIETYFYKYLER